MQILVTAGLWLGVFLVRPWFQMLGRWLGIHEIVFVAFYMVMVAWLVFHLIREE